MIISERIFYIMEQKNMSQLELSRRTGIATSNISDWKKKKTNPKADCLLSICDALDITPEQLLTGKGIDPEYKDTDMDYEVTRSDIKILKQIHSLGDEQYKRLMTYMKALQKLEQMESMVASPDKMLSLQDVTLPSCPFRWNTALPAFHTLLLPHG